MRQRDREECIALLSRENVPLRVIRDLLRYGATLRRLAEAQCNGDWPADNGQRETVACSGAEDQGCGTYWAPEVLRGRTRACPDCRAQALVRAACEPHGLEPIFGGDPRGAVLLVRVPSGVTNDWGSRGIVVA